jgi:hypothetical protein
MIRYLHGSEGLSQRAIARQLGISRDTVARAIASAAPPKYARVIGPSAFDPFEPLVRVWTMCWPCRLGRARRGRCRHELQQDRDRVPRHDH